MLTPAQRVLRFLCRDERLTGVRGRMTVFGSAARGVDAPGDIDLLLDFADHSGSVMHPSDIEGAGLLLALARHRYGSFDPFVLVGRTLWGRSDDASQWQPARNARALLRAAREAGADLDTVAARYLPPPAERAAPVDPQAPAP